MQMRRTINGKHDRSANDHHGHASLFGIKMMRSEEFSGWVDKYRS